MITTDFVNVNGIEWGKYPYYSGDTYSDGNVYFATFGCKKGIQYKDFLDGDKTITISEKTDYLSMYNNGGLKEYYGENIFQQKKSLVSRDDFIRTEENFYAIPTEEELQQLIDSSDIYCFNGKLIIHPYEMNAGVKNYKDEISIPLLGLVEYIADKPSNTTKYNVINGEIKQVGIGFHKEISPNNWNNVPPDGYPFVIIQKDDYGNITSYYCYEHGFYYSDIYLLTSSIPKDVNEYGETFAHVLHIEIKAKTLIDDESTPEYGDVEFLSFEIKVDSEGKRLIYFDDIKCCDGTTSTKDRGFMVLPIKYEGVVNVNITGNLLLNGIPFLGYNQDANKDVVPYIKINPFGIPKIENSKYNYTFSKDISDGSSILETSFYLPNGKASHLSDIIEITKIDSDKAKIKNLTGENGNYWILSNNECLYSYPKNSRNKQIIFDDRSFFSREEKTTTINITINTRFKDNYIVGDNRFVLPSIYKPFYIKRLYCIEPYYEEYDGGYQCMYFFASHTNVYNGIGLFAQKGESEINYISTVSSNSNVNNVSNNSLSTIGKINGSSVNDLPSKLKILLDSYFDGDNTFSKEYSYFYDTFKTEDLYAIGLLNDTIELRNSHNKIIKSVLSPLPIFRNKPLILSDYNDSVYDFFEYIIHNEYESNKNQTNIYVGNEFTSVIEPNTKLRFNDERTYGYRLDFGNLFNKIHLASCDANTRDNCPKCINDFDIVVKILKNQHGIRYYFVNQAFYDNYIINWLTQVESTSEFMVYKQEYYNNREYYDLNPHKVDFKHNHIWDSSFGDGYEYTLDTDKTEVKNYIPFFDMIPSLRNTKGYEYSDGDDFPNHKAPIALELYLSEDEKMLLFNPNRDCSTGSDTLDYISNYKQLYLIGASTPLTRLEGACTDPDSAYVKQIKDNTELLPQMDSTSIIYSYGPVKDIYCKGYDK